MSKLIVLGDMYLYPMVANILYRKSAFARGNQSSRWSLKASTLPLRLLLNP